MLIKLNVVVCVPPAGSSDILRHDRTSLAGSPCLGYSYSHVWRGTSDPTYPKIICTFGYYSVYVTYTSLQILPQAICTRYGLKVGAIMAPFVRVLLMIFFPISYPISKVN